MSKRSLLELLVDMSAVVEGNPAEVMRMADNEIVSLREQVKKLENRLNKDSQEFTILCAKETEKVLREQLATLAEQNEKMRAFLEFAWKYIPMSEYAFEILEHAMNLPNLATPVLNETKGNK